MASKGFSSVKFWLTQLGLAGSLIIVAVVIVVMRKDAAEEPIPEGAPEKPSVASGLSNFYREFRLSSSELIKEPVGDFVLDVAGDETPIDKRLRGMSSDLKPVSSRWEGEHKYRTFKAGSTLRTAISAYAQQEGMQLVWDLNEDFVVKHQFQSEDTIVGSLAEIAKSIDANFNGDVSAYFCPKARSLLITTNESDYVKQECKLAK